MTILVDYQGCRVRLTDERRDHILLHPEMAGMEEQIKQTVKEPQRVVRSLSDAAAELMYRFYTQTVIGDKWLCVVVKYLAKDAFVLTAYLTDKPKAGEQLWPKK